MIPRYWMNLPGPQWFSAAAIYAEQVERAVDGAVFVELGCWKGRSTSCMGAEIANSGKSIHLYAIDHWLGSDEDGHRADEDLSRGGLYQVFLENIRPVANWVTPIRSDSAAAAALFPDESVDFLYIDAEHTYAGVCRDIKAWWPKLKRGAVLAGDDWCFEEAGGVYGVRQAVQEFCSLIGVIPEVLPGEPNVEWEQWRILKG